MALFRNKYRIESARLENYDYGSAGLYFVTICTFNREYYFGEINNARNGTAEIQKSGKETQDIASLQATPIGLIAQQYWTEIPAHFAFVELDEFIVMPNHVHGILFLNNQDYTQWEKAKFGPQSNNLGSVIRGYKAAVKKFATINTVEFSWQPRYYDHIIRSDEELKKIRTYIYNNPQQWHLDRNNKQNLKM